ncbi:MAG: hypothetical protein II685_06965 [Clostridia bacterium]|nr:hypothetical protein [Clostridia bacterium]
MDKKRVDKLIPFAYNALRSSDIVKDGNKIKKTFRGQISTFGAAVSMGSLTSAVVFFSDKGGSDVERQKLLAAILTVLKEEGSADASLNSLYDFVKSAKNSYECRESILCAAIAIKLAMNLYTLEK